MLVGVAAQVLAPCIERSEGHAHYWAYNSALGQGDGSESHNYIQEKVDLAHATAPRLREALSLEMWEARYGGYVVSHLAHAQRRLRTFYVASLHQLR